MFLALILAVCVFQARAGNHFLLEMAGDSNEEVSYDEKPAGDTPGKYGDYALTPKKNPCKAKPGVHGKCKDDLDMWTFQNGMCRSFKFGGCDGSDNMFISKNNCEKECVLKG